MIKPYFQDDAVTIYHGDCREILPQLPKVDLVLTDPPYGIDWQSNFRNEQLPKIIGDTTQKLALEVIGLSLKCLKPYRHLYCFGQFDLSSLPITKTVELIWDKGNMSGGDLSLPYGKSHEYIQFGVYVPSKSNRDTGYGRLSARLRKGSILRCDRINGCASTLHPTEKPINILREIIESSSCLGELILDPFMGSGSTLIAATLEGRKAIGIEIEEKYCEIAAKRMAQMVMAL